MDLVFAAEVRYNDAVERSREQAGQGKPDDRAIELKEIGNPWAPSSRPGCTSGQRPGRIPNAVRLTRSTVIRTTTDQHARRSVQSNPSNLVSPGQGCSLSLCTPRP